MEVDDSILIHYSEGYDPVKAREYYLRTRKLKGRPRGSQQESPGRPRGNSSTYGSGQSSGNYQNASAAERQKELAAQRDALKKRLDRLREVLRELVKDAKKRSGVKTPDKASTSSTKSSSSTKKSTTKSKTESKSKPLTAQQKREKNKAAREEYAKENRGKKPALAKEVDQLRRQVKDIENRIRKAIQDAQGGTYSQSSSTYSQGNSTYSQGNSTYSSKRDKPKTASNSR